MHAAFPIPYLERHEGLAAGQVDAAPVPAYCLGRQVGAGPFVVEPGRAFDLAPVQLAQEVEMRAPVVIARLLRPVPLAAEAAFPLQHRRVGDQREIEVEIASRNPRLVAPALELEAPVVDPHPGALELGV